MNIRIDQIMSENPSRLSKADNKTIFIRHLISETTDKLQIRSELLNNLMAGRDTTASMLSNTWFELSKHSEVWSRLRKEIDLLNGIPPTYAQLQNMPYLRAIFYESMRLYPQLPENGRIALEDTVLPLGGGHNGKSPVFVPKGKVVMWGTYVLHRRDDIFGKNVNEFDPDRWLDTKKGNAVKPGWGYLAFGGGPRVCMGRTFYFSLFRLFSIWVRLTQSDQTEQFALIQASYVTARLIQMFPIIESRDSRPWIEQLALVCNGLGGCKVALRRQE